jgi:hypothetical protein
MSLPTLTADAKKALWDTVASLRVRLLDDFRAAADSVYLLSVATAPAHLPEAARMRRGYLDAWLNEQVRTAPEADRDKKPAEVRERFLMVAVKEGRAAYEASQAEDKRFVLVPRRGHNNVSRHPLYWEELAAFLQRVAAADHRQA